MVASVKVPLAIKPFSKNPSGNLFESIVGLTGVAWFAEAYFNGTYDPLGSTHIQQYEYDGIDGWAAMKREIFVCKALEFQTISVFHLNSYHKPGEIEYYGLLDYYDLGKIEELATEWTQPKTVQYPICSLSFDLTRDGTFVPNGDFIYDLETNLEMYICRGVITVGVVVWAIYAGVAGAKQRKRLALK